MAVVETADQQPGPPVDAGDAVFDDRAVHRRVRDHRAPNGGVPAPAAVIEQGTVGAEELHEALLGVLDRDPAEARAERQLPGGGRPGPEQRVDPVVEVGPEPGIDEP